MGNVVLSKKEENKSCDSLSLKCRETPPPNIHLLLCQGHQAPLRSEIICLLFLLSSLGAWSPSVLQGEVLDPDAGH